MNFMFLCQIVVSVIFSLLQNLLFSGLYVVVFLISAHDVFSEMDNLAKKTITCSNRSLHVIEPRLMILEIVFDAINLSKTPDPLLYTLLVLPRQGFNN